MTNTAAAPPRIGTASRRLPIIYPSHVKLFLECAERYQLKHEARRRVPEPFSRALVKGIALHAVTADCFAEFRAQRTFPINIRERVEWRLAQVQYPPECIAMRLNDAEEVTRFVKWILGEFAGTAEVVAIEETLTFHHPGDAFCPEFLLRAKIDLVLVHADGTLEHLDFKGGRAERDPIQEVAARIVVGAAFGDRFPTIRSTSMFAAEERVVSDVLSREDCRQTWTTIKGAITSILTTTERQPSPSPLCEFCPYFGNGCSAVPDVDGAMVDWLDGDPS